ncbi:Transcription factor E3 [Armadillidium vulgare]|nr:Transcription factor E3 [Armadillidium vulgare]
MDAPRVDESDQIEQEESIPGSMACDILGLRAFMGLKSSSSCPPDVPKVKTEPQSNADPQVVAIMKDRQKKDNHNMSITKTTATPAIIKGQILTASVSYLKKLKEDVKTQSILEEKIKGLEQDKKLLALRVKELENQLQANGIKVEEMKFDSTVYMNSFNSTEVLSPTSTAASVTSPYTPTPTPTTSPFTMNLSTTSPIPLTVSTGNYTNNVNCNSGGGESAPNDISHFNDEPLPSDESSNIIIDNFVHSESSHVKKVKSENMNLPDFLLEELLMGDFDSGDFGLNLIDDDSLTLTSDPLLSSPQISSPNSSRHSFAEALTPDSMDIGS